MNSFKTFAVLGIAGALALSFQQSTPSAYAQTPGCSECDRDRNAGVLVFGGVMTESDFPSITNLPFYSSYEDNYIAGVALSRDFVDLGLGFHFGGEVGLAARFGDGSSAEIWAGPSLRFDGIDIGPATISAGLTVGFSYVTDTIGRERDVEIQNNGDATLLYYAGPEIAVSLDAVPDTEFVVQTHHRSGGLNVPWLPTINNMPNTSNANTFGVRKRF
jgi:hypothetical protein